MRKRYGFGIASRAAALFVLPLVACSMWSCSIWSSSENGDVNVSDITNAEVDTAVAKTTQENVALANDDAVSEETQIEAPIPKEFQKESPDDTWYNEPGFRGIFGDFDVQQLPLHVTDPARRETLRVRGKYIVEGPGACGSCHAPLADKENQKSPAMAPLPLSGGRVMTDRFGLVTVPNITPDKATGIGNWAESDIARALRSSLDRKGRPLSLELHGGFRWLSDADAVAIGVYIQSLTPVVSEPIERRKLGGFQRNKWGIIPIHQKFAGYVPVFPEGETSAYGRYLVQHVAQCSLCHSPAGASDAKLLSGIQNSGGMAISKTIDALVSLFTPTDETPDLTTTELMSTESRRELGIEGKSEKVNAADESFAAVSSAERTKRDIALQEGQYPIGGPNIRGDGGLQNWSVEQIVRYLATGYDPSGAQADGRFCPWPYYRQMTGQDQRAIALYLKSLSE